MWFIRILLGCALGLFAERLPGQSFEKTEKLLGELLPEFNRAFEENNPAILKDSRYQKKLRKLRKKYSAYHNVGFSLEDSVARANNEAILLALSGQRYKAAQRLSTSNKNEYQGLVEYHRGLILLLNEDFGEASAILQRTTQRNSPVNTLVALGNLRDPDRPLNYMSTVAGADPKGKLSYNKGILSSRAGDNAEAIHHFTRALSVSDQMIYRVKRGDALLTSGETEEALADFDNRKRGETELAVRQGFVLLKEKKFVRAQEVFEACMKIKSREFRYATFLGLANALYGQGQFGAAKEYYEKVAAYKPLAASAWMGLANVALTEHRYRTALTIFDGIIARDSTCTPARLGRAVAKYGLKDYEGALTDFIHSESVIDASDESMADILVCRAYTHYRLGNREVARQDFKQAIKVDSKRYEAYAGLGQLDIDERRYPSAGKYLSAALNYEKENDRLWANYGNLLLHFGVYEKAFSVFGKAATLNPANLHAQNGRGITLLERDMLEESKSLFDSLIRTNPGRSVLLNNRGIVHSYLGNRFGQDNEQNNADRSYQHAEKDFDSALGNSPSKKFYHVNKGNVFRYWHRYEEARESYQSYQDKSALNNTAVLLAGLERMKDARYYMGVALQIDSTHRAFHYNMNLLNRGRAKEMARFVASSRDDGPYSEISIKYSLDGYVTIYLYDYEYQDMSFPGRHRLPLPPVRFGEDYLIPEYDFTFLPYSEKKKEVVGKRKSGKAPRIKLKGRSRSGTKCPVLF